MREIKDRLADVDHVGFPRELWAAAVARAAHETADEWPPAPSARPMGHRIATIAVAFAVFAAATLVLWDALGPGSSRPRPSNTTPVVNPLSRLPAGWNELPDPPDVRAGAATVWTGSRLLVWGGYVYTGFSDEQPLDGGYLLQVETGEHEPLFVSPLEPRANAASAWSGSELLVWGGSDLYGRFFDDGAAYDPALQIWRMLPEAPLMGREPFSVWTGSELIVWGSRARDQRLNDGAAYEPQTDSWRRIADAPAAFTDATAVWTGQEMFVLGSALDERNAPETATAVGMAYDPAADRWRTLPETRLSPNASTAAWSGRAVVAWDYLNNSQTYDPATNEWSDVSRVPLDEGECWPESVGVSTSIVGDYCGRLVLFDQGAWDDIAGRAYVGWGVELVAADPAALILGSNVDTGATTLLAYRVDASPPPEAAVPNILVVRCEDLGPVVESTEVRLQPDGLHVEVTNVAVAELLTVGEGFPATFAIPLREVTMTPVFPVEPGSVWVGCRVPDENGDIVGGPEEVPGAYLQVTVLPPES